MPVTIINNDQSFSTALPVQKPGQQFGSIAIAPQPNKLISQLDVINAARQVVQRTGSFVVPNDPNPLYTSNGVANGYQESKYIPAGKPMLGPVDASSTNRSAIQGFRFTPLTNSSVYGGRISNSVPPPAADTYVRRG